MTTILSRIAPKLFVLPLITLFFPLAVASELGLRNRHLPLYIQSATAADGNELHEKPTLVGVLSRFAEPESTIGFLNSPYVPHHDSSWKQSTDTNLITICGVKISYLPIEKKEDSRQFSMEVRIDASAFKKPENIKMTDDEVMELIQQAVALNFPDSKIITLESKP